LLRLRKKLFKLSFALASSYFRALWRCLTGATACVGIDERRGSAFLKSLLTMRINKTWKIKIFIRYFID
jgi:hypothetical protein